MSSEERYEGAVVFVDGVHYPATDDGPDLTRPLRWVEGDAYRDAEADEPLHNDVHHQNRLEVAFDTGDGGETVELSPEELDSVKAHLASLREKGGAN